MFIIINVTYLQALTSLEKVGIVERTFSNALAKNIIISIQERLWKPDWKRDKDLQCKETDFFPK